MPQLSLGNLVRSDHWTNTLMWSQIHVDFAFVGLINHVGETQTSAPSVNVFPPSTTEMMQGHVSHWMKSVLR